ncbi:MULTISPECIES: hypothetical protein [Streptococcus]|uniref:hypothetical protein n=1 Tax=Streptococcus TaxID=1301 RepID=UPI0003688C19|nr:hypothetical protein [Streptococcus caballi]QBX13496.1 hypothetical protein JavanS86_0004 [Streptococcus satellite phage Javan86]
MKFYYITNTFTEFAEITDKGIKLNGRSSIELYDSKAEAFKRAGYMDTDNFGVVAIELNDGTDYVHNTMAGWILVSRDIKPEEIKEKEMFSNN